MPPRWCFMTASKLRHERAAASVDRPFSLEEAGIPTKEILEHRGSLDEDLPVPPAPREGYRIENIEGPSERMVGAYRMVGRVAPTRSTVLIMGEAGTGKELIARAIHANSPRADRPFVAIDCSALAETLLESELFGHVKGAFTGALADRRGLFEAAHGGTCFLDEVGEISHAMQAKLLRVLQEHQVKRGGTESIRVDVRVTGATNKDVGKLVADGRFREDLYYRLSVVTIPLPALRERREDIPRLAAHCLHPSASANARSISHISPEAMALLVASDWPGNVRELEHAIEHAVALTTDAVILPEDLPPKCTGLPRQQTAPGRPALSLQAVVTCPIRSVLKEVNWNKKLATRLLGIHRRTLDRLTKCYGIPLEERE